MLVTVTDSDASYGLAACRYEALAQQAEAMEKPYTALAKLLNCYSDEIAIVTSSTAAWFQVKHYMTTVFEAYLYTVLCTLSFA